MRAIRGNNAVGWPISTLLILVTHAPAPQAMARRSDGPWILKGQSNNCNYGSHSFGVDNAPYGTSRTAGDVYDMKGCALHTCLHAC